MLTFLGIFIYLLVGGAIRQIAQNKWKQNCYYERTGMCDGLCGHTTGSFFLGLAWPIGLPIVLGGMLTNFSVYSIGDSRRSRELQRAEHRRRVAEIDAEAIYIAERSLSRKI